MKVLHLNFEDRLHLMKVLHLNFVSASGVTRLCGVFYRLIQSVEPPLNWGFFSPADVTVGLLLAEWTQSSTLSLMQR